MRSPWLIHTVCFSPGFQTPSNSADLPRTSTSARPNSRWWPLSTLPPSCCGHRHLAVADAEHRNAGLEDLLRRARAVAFRHRARAAREDHALRPQARERLRRLVERHDLAIDARLAHAPRDELRHLAAEIDDEDGGMGGAARSFMRLLLGKCRAACRNASMRATPDGHEAACASRCCSRKLLALPAHGRMREGTRGQDDLPEAVAAARRDRSAPGLWRPACSWPRSRSDSRLPGSCLRASRSPASFRPSSWSHTFPAYGRRSQPLAASTLAGWYFFLPPTTGPSGMPATSPTLSCPSSTSRRSPSRSSSSSADARRARRGAAPGARHSPSSAKSSSASCSTASPTTSPSSRRCSTCSAHRSRTRRRGRRCARRRPASRSSPRFSAGCTTRRARSSGFGPFVEDLCRDVLNAAGARNIVCLVSAAEAAIPPDKLIPVALIVTELISNALEHGFAGGRNGTIRIDLTPEGTEHVLTIADDGNGLPPDFSLEARAGTGLRIVQALAQQIEGRFAMENGPRHHVPRGLPVVEPRRLGDAARLLDDIAAGDLPAPSGWRQRVDSRPEHAVTVHDFDRLLQMPRPSPPAPGTRRRAAGRPADSRAGPSP